MLSCMYTGQIVEDVSVDKLHIFMETLGLLRESPDPSAVFVRQFPFHITKG